MPAAFWGVGGGSHQCLLQRREYFSLSQKYFFLTQGKGIFYPSLIHSSSGSPWICSSSTICGHRSEVSKGDWMGRKGQGVTAMAICPIAPTVPPTTPPCPFPDISMFVPLPAHIPPQGCHFGSSKEVSECSQNGHRRGISHTISSHFMTAGHCSIAV